MKSLSVNLFAFTYFFEEPKIFKEHSGQDREKKVQVPLQISQKLFDIDEFAVFFGGFLYFYKDKQFLSASQRMLTRFYKLLCCCCYDFNLILINCQRLQQIAVLLLLRFLTDFNKYS